MVGFVKFLAEGGGTVGSLREFAFGFEELILYCEQLIVGGRYGVKQRLLPEFVFVDHVLESLVLIFVGLNLVEKSGWYTFLVPDCWLQQGYFFMETLDSFAGFELFGGWAGHGWWVVQLCFQSCDLAQQVLVVFPQVIASLLQCLNLLF